jgi:GNAT superfamily N-acetyltransferase
VAKSGKTSALKIRQAKTSDAARLADLSGQLGYPTTPAQIAQRLKRLKSAPRNALWVADHSQDGVAGWIHVSAVPLIEVDYRAEINAFVVGEKHRSQGAGAQLLAAAEEWARKQGCKGVSVRSNVIRERAHKFYERNGYEHYKTQKAFRKSLGVPSQIKHAKRLTK